MSGPNFAEPTHVVNVFRLGEWVEFYVGEEATDDQVKAAEQLMKTIFAEDFPPDGEALSTERAPVSIERTPKKLKFSIPTSSFEIEMMKGANGKATKIQNLPLVWTTEFIQYKSNTVSHKSKNKQFSFANTNGYTAKMEASSKK